MIGEPYTRSLHPVVPGQRHVFGPALVKAFLIGEDEEDVEFLRGSLGLRGTNECRAKQCGGRGTFEKITSRSAHKPLPSIHFFNFSLQWTFFNNQYKNVHHGYFHRDAAFAASAVFD